MSGTTYAYTIIALVQPTQAKEQRVAGELLRIREFVVHVAHTTLPWNGRRGLPWSGICNFLEVWYQETKTLPGLIEQGFRRSSSEKTRIQADHHSDRDRRAWKIYATIGIGVADNIEHLRAAFVQRSRWRLAARREKRGRD